MKREIETRDSDPWVVAHSVRVFKVLHPLLESLLSACHLCSCGTDILLGLLSDNMLSQLVYLAMQQ